MPRAATVTRTTKETDIRLSLDLDGTGRAEIATGIGFFDHMLTLLAGHSLLDLTIACTGDTHVDGHHTVEDVGRALGFAVAEALGDRRGIRRYGHCVLPMDESLVTAAVASTIGSVAFVGLVVPHALRLGARLSHRALLSASALGGALLLVLADTLCRALASEVDLRPGTISSAIGAPFFLWLLVRRKAA